MGYTPHEWTSGEVVTASKMNALEQGVAEGGGGYRVTFGWDESLNNGDGGYTCDRTLDEIIAAYRDGQYVYAVDEEVYEGEVESASQFELSRAYALEGDMFALFRNTEVWQDGVGMRVWEITMGEDGYIGENMYEIEFGGGD